MGNIFEVLDYKRWALILLPFIIFIAGIFVALQFTENIQFHTENIWESILKKYRPLLYLNIPKELKKFDTGIFNYFYLIPIKEFKTTVKKSKNEIKKPPPSYNISLIYIRDGKRYVVVNGKILTEGSKISDKEYIVKIEENGILLNGYWGTRWIRF